MISSAKGIILFALSSLLTNAGAQSSVDNSGLYHIPIGSPGFQQNHSTAAVTFDQHSLFLNGQRVMIYSGEYHPWRTPTGEVLWRDVLEKFKAAGFSAISIYLHWGLSVAKPGGSIDLEYYRSVTDFLNVAKSVGLLVSVRPGPYINAETTAGGFPGWLTNIQGKARTNASDYTAAWTPWITEVSQVIAPFQYPDGPVIAIQSENEFSPGTTESPHMQAIEDTYRANGLTKIPIFHNDYQANGYYASPGLGQVDMYGFDAYPMGFDCSNPTVWGEVPTNYDASHQKFSPAEPLWSPEYQGGSFDPWKGPGYDKCYQLINEQFANVYYKNIMASGVTLLSMYMTYGGTNWGNLAEPTVYSSYDYGSAIREDRSLTVKYGEMKLQAHFLASSPAYLTAVRIGVGASTVYSNSAQVFTTNLKDPITGTNFYFVRQTTNQNLSPINFTLNANTSAGLLTVPQYGAQITLAGRESKIIVTNYTFGSSKLLYSTAEVYTWTTIDKVDYIILYALKGQAVEAVVSGTGLSAPKISGSSTISASSSNGTTIITGTTSGVSVVTVGSAKVIVVDKQTAYSFWSPRLTTAPYFNVGPASSAVLVHGPYLVRNATISADSRTLSLVGDTNSTTTIDVFAPSSVKTIKWNGQNIPTTKNAYGASSGTIKFKYSAAPRLPSLVHASWKCQDSFPESQLVFDDSNWVTANKTSTFRPETPTAGTYVLYADEYGYHQGNVIFRGHFNGTAATELQLSVQGGTAFGFSVFLNGKFLGSGVNADADVDTQTGTYTLNSTQLNAGDNVVAVILDNMGLDEDWNINDSYKNPRGIRGYTLTGATFSYWKVQGNYGGEDFPDAVRGPLNEGGLWAERVGAHLPGYDDSRWPSCSPLTGISSAGVTAYRTSFHLDFPIDADVPISLKFTPTTNSTTGVISNYRSLIYINGWQFGKYTDNLGPQRSYVLPEGILNLRGSNELLITLWSLDPQGAKISNIELVSTAVIQSGKGHVPTTVVSPTYAQLR